MAAKINLDKLDYQIIQHLVENAEISYADLGKKLFVSGGTVHVRIKKLEELGIAKGTRLAIDHKNLGYDVIAFLGIYLEKSSMYDSVAQDLRKIPEIVRLNYTTGNYSMFCEIVCKDIAQLRRVLHDQLQKIKYIERTETFISLEESFNRNIQVIDIMPPEAEETEAKQSSDDTPASGDQQNKVADALIAHNAVLADEK